MRYFIELSYKGTQYHGWQRQKGVISVQSVIEAAISKVLNSPVYFHCCGRTDAGVHASQFYVHFKWFSKLPLNLVYKLNCILPADICIFRIVPVSEFQHVQRDVDSRTYRYFIHQKKNPFLDEISTLIEDDLDLGAMIEAFTSLVGINDYQHLCKQPALYTNTLCKVYSIEMTNSEDESQIVFTIEANRFLRRMVRLLMARVIDVGKSKLSAKEFIQNINEVRPFEHQNYAHPQGLYLSSVIYPFIEDIKRAVPVTISE